MYAVFLRGKGAHIQRCLHKSGKVEAHFLHALRQRKERGQHGLCFPTGQCRLFRRAAASQAKPCITGGILILQNTAVLSDKAAEFFCALRRHRHHGLGLRADYIVKLAAANAAQPKAVHLQ